MSDIINYSKKEIAYIVMNDVAKVGIGNITVEYLVKLLPFSRRTFFRIFESKEELLFEIYKHIIAILNQEVNIKQQAINVEDNDALQKAIDAIINVFIEHDEYIRFINEFDALTKGEAIAKQYDEFYMTINFIYNFMLRIYDESKYERKKLLALSIIILESIYGLTYRYSITKRSNYKLRIDVDNINQISAGLAAIVDSSKK